MKQTVTLSALASVVRRGTEVPAIRGMIREWGSTGRLSERLTGTPCSGWKRCALSTVANTHCAPKLGAERLQPSDWVLDLEDIESDSGKLLARRSALERNSSSSKAAFQTGDVLYGKLRPYLNKVIIADAPGFCTTEIIPIRPGPDLCSRYLHVALTSPSFLRYANRLSYGMKMPRLGTDDLDSAEILVPPLAEQKRIVAKVDELMALCDRLEGQLQERDARSSDLSKAALAKFSEEPTVENLEYLFHPSFSITTEDIRNTILRLAASRRLAERSTSVDATVGLGEIVDIINGRAYAKEELLQAGTPVLRVGNLFTSKQWYYSDLQLPPEKYCDSGDLLYAWSASFGPFIWNGPKCIFHYHIWKLVPKVPQVDLRFLYWVLHEKTAEIKAAGHGVSMVHMTKAKMEKVKVELPPLAEQRRIVAKVEELMALVDQLEAQLAASEETGTKLLDALVAELAPSN